MARRKRNSPAKAPPVAEVVRDAAEAEVAPAEVEAPEVAPLEAGPEPVSPAARGGGRARAGRTASIGRVLAQGPNGPIHELLQAGRVEGWIELGQDPLALKALEARAERLVNLRHPFLSRTHGMRQVGDLRGLQLDASDAVDLVEVGFLGPIPLGPAIDLFRKVGRALYAGWELQTARQPAAGLVHSALDARDIWIDAAGHVRVHGLGLIAVGAGPEGRHVATARVESPATAPELLRGEPATHASDVYSMGVWLVRAVSGRDVAWASSSEEWQEATTASAVHQVLESTGDKGLADLTSRMLAFDPAQRPSAQAVEQALERLRKAQDRDALARWSADVVATVLQSRALRAPAVEGVTQGRTGPPAVDRPPRGPAAGLGVGIVSTLRSEGESAGEPHSQDRPLWEIRGSSEVVGPSPGRDRGEVVSPGEGPVDPDLLRDRLDEVPTENSSEVLDLGTGRFALGSQGLRPVKDDEGLGLDLVSTDGGRAEPPARAGATSSPGAARHGAGTDERPPTVPKAPPVAPASSPAPPPRVPTSTAAAAAAPRPAAASARPAATTPTRTPAPVPAEPGQDWTWIAAGAVAAIVVLGILWWAWARPSDGPPGYRETTASQVEEPARPAAAAVEAVTVDEPAANADPEPPSVRPPPAAPPPAEAAEVPVSPPTPVVDLPPTPVVKPAATATATSAPKTTSTSAPKTTSTSTPTASTATPTASTTSTATNKTAPAGAPRVDPTIPPKPIPVRDAPAAVVAEATSGQVVVKGDASRVRFTGSGGSYTAGGEVPPGAYEVTAWFGETVVEVGALVVRAGQTSTIDCKSAFVRCSVR